MSLAERPGAGMVETCTLVWPEPRRASDSYSLVHLLDHPIARQRFVRVIPAQPQAPPELGIEAVPVMVESQDIAAEVGPAGEQARLGGEHGLVVGVRDVGIASPPIVALVDHRERHAAPDRSDADSHRVRSYPAAARAPRSTPLSSCCAL